MTVNYIIPYNTYTFILFSAVNMSGLSNLSAMAGRIDFILGMAGQYTISAAIKAIFKRDFLNVSI